MCCCSNPCDSNIVDSIPCQSVRLLFLRTWCVLFDVGRGSWIGSDRSLNRSKTFQGKVKFRAFSFLAEADAEADDYDDDVFCVTFSLLIKVNWLWFMEARWKDGWMLLI